MRHGPEHQVPVTRQRASSFRVHVVAGAAETLRLFCAEDMQLPRQIVEVLDQADARVDEEPEKTMKKHGKNGVWKPGVSLGKTILDQQPKRQQSHLKKKHSHSHKHM